MRDPTIGIYAATALFMETVSVAKIFGNHFQRLWDEAIPAEKMVKDLERDVEIVSYRLKERAFTEMEIRVYKSLLRMGASSLKIIQKDLQWADKEGTPSLKLLNKVLNKLVNRGIVERHQALDFYMPTHPKTLLQTL